MYDFATLLQQPTAGGLDQSWVSVQNKEITWLSLIRFTDEVVLARELAHVIDVIATLCTTYLVLESFLITFTILQIYHIHRDIMLCNSDGDVLKSFEGVRSPLSLYVLMSPGLIMKNLTAVLYSSTVVTHDLDSSQESWL